MDHCHFTFPLAFCDVGCLLVVVEVVVVAGEGGRCLTSSGATAGRDCRRELRAKEKGRGRERASYMYITVCTVVSDRDYSIIDTLQFHQPLLMTTSQGWAAGVPYMRHQGQARD